MASNSNKQTLDLLLKCALCNSDLVNNQPKSLPCLHTFCAPCLTKEHQRFVQKDNIFKCPLCHTSVNRSLEDYSEMTNNLELDVIIEKLLHVRHLQQSERHCEMCPEGVTVVSNQWCLDCGKFLCDSCLVQHGKYKPKDKVIDVSQGVDSEKVGDFILPTKCSRHEEKFKLYCAQCDICLCADCLEEHRSVKNANCVLASIEKVTPDTKSQGRQLLEETCSHLEREKQQIKDMKLKIEDLKRQCSEKGNKIWEHVEETVRRLKENTRVLIAELEAATKVEIDELDQFIQLRQDHVEELEIIDNNFRQLLQSFDNVDILLNFPRLKSKCKNLLMKPDNNVPSTLHEVNMVYYIWYLQTQEMSKNVPLGRWDLELTESPSLDKSSSTKQASNVLQRCLLPPAPCLCYPKLEEFNDDKFHDVSCIFVIDKNHVLVSCFGTLYEYNKANSLCGIHEPDGMQFCSDLCRFSSDKMCVVDGNLILLQINKIAPFLTFFKRIKPDVKYYSICNCFGEILVCDYNCCVHLLNEEGTVRRTILDIKRKPSSNHKIRRGPFKETFLLLHYNEDPEDRKLFCYSLDGSTCLFLVNVGRVWDLCTDKYGNIYVAENNEMYVLSPDTSEKYPMFVIKDKTHRPHIFIKDDLFYFASDYTGVFKLERIPLHYHDQSS